MQCTKKQGTAFVQLDKYPRMQRKVVGPNNGLRLSVADI